MRYVQLRAFHHVAVLGGFSRAAEELHLTQPAISDQVRKLEEDYDLLLFDRRKRRVTLTAEGAELLAITRRMFEAERQAQDLLSEARSVRSGQLRIVADAAVHLSRILARFQHRHPGVRVSLQTGNSETVLEKLRSYEADIGVMGEIPESPAFKTIGLGASPIVACVARGSPLARLDRIEVEQLAAEPLIMREDGSKTRTKLIAAAKRAGVKLKPAIEVEGREAVRELVAAGGGVGFISRAEFGRDSHLVPLPIHPADDLEMNEVVVCLRQRSQGRLIGAFLELAREASRVSAGPT